MSLSGKDRTGWSSYRAVRSIPGAPPFPRSESDWRQGHPRSWSFPPDNSCRPVHWSWRNIVAGVHWWLLVRLRRLCRPLVRNRWGIWRNYSKRSIYPRPSAWGSLPLSCRVGACPAWTWFGIVPWNVSRRWAWLLVRRLGWRCWLSLGRSSRVPPLTDLRKAGRLSLWFVSWSVGFRSYLSRM